MLVISTDGGDIHNEVLDVVDGNYRKCGSMNNIDDPITRGGSVSGFISATGKVMFCGGKEGGVFDSVITNTCKSFGKSGVGKLSFKLSIEIVIDSGVVPSAR